MKKNIIFVILYILWFIIAIFFANSYKSDIKIYNQANALYASGAFEQALSEYNSINTWDNQLLDRYMLYNKWNTYFRQGENTGELTEKIDLWKKAIQSYKDSLDIEEDEDARYNLNLVEKRLKDLQKKNPEQEKQKQDEKESQKDKKNKRDDNSSKDKEWKSSDSNSKDNKENSDKSSDNKGNKKEDNSSKDKEWKSSDSESNNKKWEKQQSQWKNSWSTNNSTSNQNGLSPEALQEIEQYKQSLKKNQKSYGQYYNKKYQDPRKNNPLNDFFNDPFFDDPFFDNSSLNKAQEDVKDW